MSDEKQAFSRRLAEAMRAKGYDPKPGVLLKKFNSRYKGRSVAFSTASKWLRGMALPEQDKLQVLADLFGVEPHLLRFGGQLRRPGTRAVAHHRRARAAGRRSLSGATAQASTTGGRTGGCAGTRRRETVVALVRPSPQGQGLQAPAAKVEGEGFRWTTWEVKVVARDDTSVASYKPQATRVLFCLHLAACSL
jgi:hypothetical protein